MDCTDRITRDNEETADFPYDDDRPWLSKKKASYKSSQDGLTLESKPWRYQNSSQLDGYPIVAQLETYYGGGYVVELFPRWNNTAILQNLKKKQWLDRHSRALIVEFSLINPTTNQFNTIFIVFEFPPR